MREGNPAEGRAMLDLENRWRGFAQSILGCECRMDAARRKGQRRCRHARGRNGVIQVGLGQTPKAVALTPAPPHQLSRKLLRILDRLGCLSLRNALASIWRMRS